MDVCRFCGGPVLEVLPGFFKCIGLCGQYFRDEARGPLPKLEVVSTLARLTAHEAGVETTAAGEGLSADMLIFITRVAERLAPTIGLDEESAVRARQVQDRFRRELVDIFQGKGNFKKWFERTRTNLGLHTHDFMTVLYESLHGLKSSEAQELREQYGEAMQRRIM